MSNKPTDQVSADLRKQQASKTLLGSDQMEASKLAKLGVVDEVGVGAIYERWKSNSCDIDGYDDALN